MKIEKLPKPHHIGIIVPDMDQMIAQFRALYGDLPGMDLVYTGASDRLWTDGREIMEKGMCKLCIVEWMDGLKIEIIQPVFGENYTEDFEHARFVKSVGGGLHHIAYYVTENYLEYRQLVLDLGAKVIFESETDDHRGYRRCCYLRLPGSNVVIEVAEPPKPATAEDAF